MVDEVLPRSDYRVITLPLTPATRGLLDDFGGERGVTAGAFPFGFLVSAVLSPSLGRLMDPRGPRVVIGG